jgi:hypothetical protein
VCVCVCIHAGRRPCFIKDAMRRSLAQLLHFWILTSKRAHHRETF